jgi:hypothetical protein
MKLFGTPRNRNAEFLPIIREDDNMPMIFKGLNNRRALHLLLSRYLLFAPTDNEISYFESFMIF